MARKARGSKRMKAFPKAVKAPVLTPAEEARLHRREIIEAAWRKRHPEKAHQEMQFMRMRAAAEGALEHKRAGKVETHAKAAATHEGALAQLYRNGTISSDELAWAEEIAYVAERIERGVTVRTASLETRVDQSRGGVRYDQERLNQVRREVAYTRWRAIIPSPKRAVLDMVTGEAVGYTVAARRYSLHNRRAKKMLLDALAMWPECMQHARNSVDQDDLEAAHALLS